MNINIMSKIPTAEEFIVIYNSKPQTDSLLVAFAKLHVKAQRDDILKKVSLTDFAQEFLQEGASDAIDEESIINAYPLDNIK